jgi:Tol biopolymer transport system component/DNA-binding SARP family transcriptional activator
MSQPSPETHPLPNPLLLRNLGGLWLENGGRPIVGAGNQRQRLAVLSVIALSAQRGASRDRLLALFWPDSDTERARGALNQALYALRRDVGERDLTLGTTTLRLNPEVIRSDVAAFERALDERELETAVQLYGGPFLDGVHVEAAAEFDQWVETQRDRLAQRYTRALEELARAASAGGDAAAALEWWQRLARIDPLNAKAALGLVEALAAAGDRARAVQHAARHEATLRAELDLPPDPALARLVAALRTAPSPEPRVASIPRLDVRGGGTEPTQARGAVAAPAPTVEPRARRAGIVPFVATAAVVTTLALAAIVVLRRPGGYEIGRATQLTREPGLEIEPALSPDGDLVAYAAGPLNRMRIYVRQPGGRAVPVTADSGGGQSHPAWSPDGNRLLFVQGGVIGALVVVPALGGTPRVLVRDSVLAAAWAPDGERVAFVRGDSLYVVPFEGGPPHGVAGVPDPGEVSWSPDGRNLAVSSGNAAFAAVSAVDFGNRGPSRILVVPVDGGRPVAVTDGTSLHASPVWAPDSRRLLFVSDRDGPRDVYAVRLGASGLPAGAAVRLTVGLSAHSIALSADGRRLAYSVFVQRANIWSLPIAQTPGSPSAAVPVTTGSQVIEQLSVTADGARLYYDSDREGNADLIRQALPRGEPIQITRDTADDFGPVESPDGRWVAFHSLRYGTRDIFVMPAEGGEAVRVTSDSAQELLATWAPDSRALAYALMNAGERSGTYVVTEDSAGHWAAARRVAPIPRGPVWSPDGRFLLTVWNGVQAIPLDGGPPRVLYRPRAGTGEPVVGAAVWTPGGRSIVLKSHDQDDVASFWTMPALGGRPRLLARLDDPSRPSPRNELASDGLQIYCVVYDRQSDIFVTGIAGLR